MIMFCHRQKCASYSKREREKEFVLCYDLGHGIKTQRITNRDRDRDRDDYFGRSSRG